MNIITVQITEDGKFYRLADSASAEFQPFPEGIELGKVSGWDYLALQKAEKLAIDAVLTDCRDILKHVTLDQVIEHWLGNFKTLEGFLHCVMDEEKIPAELWQFIDLDKFWKCHALDYWMIEYKGQFVWFDKSLLSLIP